MIKVKKYLIFGTKSSDKKYSCEVSNICWFDSYLAIGFQWAGIFWWPEHLLPMLHQPRILNELDSKKNKQCCIINIIFLLILENLKTIDINFILNDWKFTYSLLNFLTHGLFLGNANERRWVRNLSWDDSKSHLPVILFCSFIIRSMLSFHSM